MDQYLSACYISSRYYMLISSDNWHPAPEPKALCNKILADTIKEEDKYQEGLTKIFFRAGMLALLESRRSNRLNSLVTLVQKNVRRKLAAQKYQQMRKSAIKIQTWWRGILAKRFVLGVRKEAAVLRFQRAARSFIQRSRFHAVRRSVIAIQSRMFLSFVTCKKRSDWSLPTQIRVVLEQGKLSRLSELHVLRPVFNLYSAECKLLGSLSRILCLRYFF